MATVTETLEEQELNGGLLPEQYAVLLTSYFVANDLLNAKFLWKRIPTQSKQANLELERIWNVGKKLWTRDYVGCYATMKQDWSENVKPVMAQLHQSIRERLVSLVSNAYSYIRINDFAALIDSSIDESIAFALNKGWKYDSASLMLEPVAETKDSKVALNNERQLQLLADYVSFLEN